MISNASVSISIPFPISRKQSSIESVEHKRSQMKLARFTEQRLAAANESAAMFAHLSRQHSAFAPWR